MNFKVKKVSNGPFHSAFINEFDELYTYGSNEFSKLGHSDIGPLFPQKVEFENEAITDVKCGRDFTVALTKNFEL